MGDFSDPIGLSAVYVHRDQIGELAKLTGSTLDNALSRLAKTGAIHRQPGSGRAVRGKYGLGPEG
ncbi:hypothetical protein [Streptomyces sp. NPDC014744]|uniref:hypothetical protein n=1 Tax=Streptomyces sp. NPDC014744 TaxID=3364903 RepID=UPI0036FFB2B8